MTHFVLGNDGSAILQTLDSNLTLSVGETAGIGGKVKQYEGCNNGSSGSRSSFDLYQLVITSLLGVSS